MRYRFMRYPEGKSKAVTLSYDDGVRQDIRLAETLGKYGMKCTFNLNSGYMNADWKDSKLMPEEIQKYLLDAGHEIAVHGELHRAPGVCRPVEVIREMFKGRETLEQAFGRIIRGLAYPDSGITNFQNNEDYATVRRILQDLDIVYARTLGADNNTFKLPNDWYAWVPTTHHKKPYAIDYAKEFVELDTSKAYGAGCWPRLFYMWGHSYEFDRDNNWNLLEELCQILGGHEDIWYATNMEIWEYVNAYNSLVFSADSTIVYNPTLFTIWFNVDGVDYTVEPGQTTRVAE